MKEPVMAPVYVMLYIQACEVARECGYALAVHGTLARDMDLLAVPWTDEAIDAELLVAKIGEKLAWAISDENGKRPHVSGPVEKPHGRRAWTIPYYGQNQIDLSVMPKQPSPSEKMTMNWLVWVRLLKELPTLIGDVVAIAKAAEPALNFDFRKVIADITSMNFFQAVADLQPLLDLLPTERDLIQKLINDLTGLNQAKMAAMNG